MNTILWVGQVLLAALFLNSGICKSILSEQKLIARGQTGVVGRSPGLIRFIGITEVFGAFGIILPWLLGILSWLTPLTALCFAVIMALAAPIHYRLKEPRNTTLNLVVLVISLLVAWGRARAL
jgi:hypothetical protein